jgi:hypothetical protein
MTQTSCAPWNAIKTSKWNFEQRIKEAAKKLTNEWQTRQQLGITDRIACELVNQGKAEFIPHQYRGLGERRRPVAWLYKKEIG